MELRATFDNFDFKILANVILKNHRNSDFHWISHYLTLDRISSVGLDDTKPLVNDIGTFSNSNYLLCKDELQLFRKEFIVLVSRVLVEFFPCLSSLESVIPKHIKHRFSAEMAKKSIIINLPIVPYNQSKHSDVVQYLEVLQELLTKVYAPDEESNTEEVPVSQLEKLERTETLLKGVSMSQEVLLVLLFRQTSIFKLLFIGDGYSILEEFEKGTITGTPGPLRKFVKLRISISPRPSQ